MGALFTFLVLMALRLPAVYPLIVALVAAALGVAAAATVTGSTLLLHIAGFIVLTFAFLGYWAFVSVGQAATGGKPIPPLGAPPVH